MAFPLIILKVLEVLKRIKNISDALNSLRNGNLVSAIVSNYISSEIFNSIDSLVGNKIKNPFREIENEISNIVEFDSHFDRFQGKDAFLDSPLFTILDTPQELTDDVANTVDNLLLKKIREFTKGDSVQSSEKAHKNIQVTADPIELHSGTFIKQIVDLNINGAGINFEFKRTYRSSSNYIGPLGFNWDHSYNIRLIKNDEFTYTLLGGELNEILFVQHPRFSESLSYQYYSPSGGFDAALIHHENSFILKFPKGKRYIFSQRNGENGKHKLEQIEDRFGNNLKFLYEEDERYLKRVEINSDSRYVKFEYDEFNRIKRLIDHTDRFIEYSYNDNGFLSGFRGPVDTNDQFAESINKEKYEYELINSDYKLVFVYDWKGRIITENSYNGDSLSDHFGKVIKQIENNGEAFFDYEELLTNKNLYEEYSNLTPVLRVWEYRRNGHEIEHLLNINGNELWRKEQWIEEGRPKTRSVWSKYNEAGLLVAQVDGNSYLSQYQYGREKLGKTLDLVLDETPLDEFLSFNLSFAEVNRERAVNVPMEYESSFWDRYPDEGIFALNSDDRIVRYEYDNHFQLISRKSDSRSTTGSTVSPDEIAKSTHYEYKTDEFNHFVLSKILYPDATWPSSLEMPDGTSRNNIRHIQDEFIEYDQFGRVLKKKEKLFETTNEYYESEDFHEEETEYSKVGYLKKTIEPVLNWTLNKNFIDIQECFVRGSFSRQSTRFLIEPSAVLELEFEGTGIELWNDAYDINRNQSTEININIDLLETYQWDQSTTNVFKLNNLSKQIHRVRLTSNSEWSIGRVIAYSSTDFMVDRLGLVTSEENPRGFRKEFAYDQNDNVIEITHYLQDYSFKELFEYDPVGNLKVKTTEWKNAEGEFLEQQSVVESNTFNKANQIIEKIRTDGIRSEKRTDKFVYNGNDQLIQNINSRGITSYLGYDSLERNVKLSVAACSPDQVIQYFGFDKNDNKAYHINGNKNRTIEEVDYLGRSVLKIDPKGNIRSYKYDKNDNIVEERTIEHNEDGTYQIIKVKGYQYDELNQMICEVVFVFDSPLPFEDLANAISVIEISDKKSVTKLFNDYNYNETTILNPLGGKIHHYKDLGGKVVCETTPGVNTSINVYDPNANLVKKYVLELRLNRNDQADKDQIFGVKYEFDALDRQTRKIDVLNTEWISRYDSLGNLTKSIDPEGRETKHTFNCFGENVLTEEKYIEDTEAVRWIETLFEYDDNGNNIVIRDANKVETRYVYDALDRLKHTTYDAAHASLYDEIVYDKNNNIITYIDFNGLIKRNTYNSIDQLVRIVFDDSETNLNLDPISVKETSYAYNMDSELLVANNGHIEVRFDRDSRGLPINESTLILIDGRNQLFSILREYDLNGVIYKLTHYNNEEVFYSHDIYNRLMGINVNNSNSLVTYKYLGNRLAEVKYNSGFVQQLGYEKRGFLLEQRLFNELGNQIWREQKVRDFAKNIKVQSTIDENSTISKVYDYDSINRLTAYSDQDILLQPNEEYNFQNLFRSSNQGDLAEYIQTFAVPSQKNYEYDDLGNRISSEEDGNNRNYTSNALNQYNNAGERFNLFYDDNGNYNRSNQVRYFYDGNDLLIRKRNGINGEVEIYRDPLDRIVLIRDVHSGDDTLWLYNGENIIEERKEGVETSVKSYVHDNQPIKTIFGLNTDTNQFICFDHLMSPRVFVDTNSARSLFFNPYGQELSGTIINHPFYYAGMVKHELLNEYLTKYRIYNADFGRFMQRDPLGFEDSINIYSYSQNSPINFIDPNGLATQDQDLIFQDDYRRQQEQGSEIPKLKPDPELIKAFENMNAYVYSWSLPSAELIAESRGKIPLGKAISNNGKIVALLMVGISFYKDDPLPLKIMSGVELGISFLPAQAQLAYLGGKMIGHTANHFLEKYYEDELGLSAAEAWYFMLNGDQEQALINQAVRKQEQKSLDLFIERNQPELVPLVPTARRKKRKRSRILRKRKSRLKGAGVPRIHRIVN